MRRYSKITPEGTRDLLFEECNARRIVESRLLLYLNLEGITG